MIFFSISVLKSKILSSHVTSSTPTKSNIYLADMLATVVTHAGLSRLLSSHVPNPMSLCHCLCLLSFHVPTPYLCATTCVFSLSTCQPPIPVPLPVSSLFPRAKSYVPVPLPVSPRFPCAKSYVPVPLLMSCRSISPSSRCSEMFCNKVSFIE
jgi:hypothetical protein